MADPALEALPERRVGVTASDVPEFWGWGCGFAMMAALAKDALSIIGAPRMTIAKRRLAPLDLEALEIDAAHTRWLAVLDLLSEQRTRRERLARKIRLEVEYLALVERCAHDRGAHLRPGLCRCGEPLYEPDLYPHWLDHWGYWVCDCGIQACPSHDIVARDYLQARYLFVNEPRFVSVPMRKRVTEIVDALCNGVV